MPMIANIRSRLHDEMTRVEWTKALLPPDLVRHDTVVHLDMKYESTST